MNSLHFQPQTRWLVTVILLFALSISNAWGETLVLTFNGTTNAYSLVTTASTSQSTFTQGTTTLGYKSCVDGSNAGKHYIQFNKGAGVLYNTTAIPGNITNIKVEYRDGTSEKSDLGVKCGTSKIDSRQTESLDATLDTDGGSYDDCDFEESNGFTYFNLSVQGGTGNSYGNIQVTKITITYTAASTCSTPPTVAAPNKGSISVTGATVSCTGITKGDCDIDEWGFFYKTGSSGVTTSDTKVQVSAAKSTTNVSSFNKSFTELNPNTHYYFAAYAKVGSTYYLSSETDFTTKTLTSSSSNTTYGTVSRSGRVITGSLKSGGSYGSPAYTVTGASGGSTTTVEREGNRFTVTSNSTSNITVTINFEAKGCEDHYGDNVVSGTSADVSTYGPVQAYYKYSVRQILYTKTDLGLAAGKKGVVKSIYFQYAGASAMDARDITIYMANTDLTELSTSNYVPFSSFSEVYDGTFSCASAGWYEIILDDPFEYNGAGNLVVLIDDNTGSYESSKYFKYHEASTTTGAQIYYNYDDSHPDPSADETWSTSSTATNYRPNTKFCIQEADMTPATVTLMDNGATITEASAGAGVTLPSRTGCTGYTFAGWTKTWVAPQSSWTTTAPTIIPAGSYTPTTDENLYPVYTKTEGGGGFKLSLNSGGTEYYIGSKGDGNYMSAVTDAASAVIFTFADGKLSYDNSGTKTYISSGGDNTTLTVGTDIPSSTWTESGTTSYSYQSSASGSRYLGFNKDASPKRFAPYASSYPHAFTKHSASTTSYISVPNCCTPLGDINGSVTSINHNSATLQWDKLSNVDGTTPYEVTVSPSEGVSVGGIDLSGAKAQCTITGLTCETDYTFTITANGASGYCNKSQNVAETTTTCLCGSEIYSFHWGTSAASTETANWNAMNYLCFTSVGSNEWQITDFVIGSYTAMNKFGVGKANVVYGSGLGSNNSKTVVTTLEDQLYLGLTQNCGAGQAPKVRAGSSSKTAEGAIGTIRIYDNSSWNNLYCGFIPNGYGLMYGATGSGSEMAMHTTANANEWETDLTSLTADMLKNDGTYKAQVGLLTSSDSYVDCGNSNPFNFGSMGVFYGGSWHGNVKDLAAGTKGKFQIWADNCTTDPNWRVHFIPYYTINYYDLDDELIATDYVAYGTASTTLRTVSGHGWRNVSTGDRSASGNVTNAFGSSLTLSTSQPAGTYDFYLVAPGYTVTFSTPACVATPSPITSNSVTLPAEPTTTPDGYTFEGWTTNAAISGTTTTKPTVYAAGSTYNPTAATTMRAVYSTSSGSGSAVPFDILKNSASITAGYYLISYGQTGTIQGCGNEIDRNKISPIEVSSTGAAATMNSSTSDAVYQFIADGDYWQLKNMANNKFLAITGEANKVEFVSSVTDAARWSVNLINGDNNGDTHYIICKQQVSSQNYYLRYKDSKWAANYYAAPATNGCVIYLFYKSAAPSFGVTYNYTTNPTCKFVVSVSSPDNVTITATPSGGSAVAEGGNSGATVTAGTTVTLSGTPSNCYGSLTWQVTRTSDDVDVTATVLAGTTLTMPAYDVTVTASVSASPSYTITYSIPSGGGSLQGTEGVDYDVTACAGSPATLPNVTGGSLTCAKFVGWYDGSSYSSSSKPSSNFYAAGASYTPESNVTLKALYAIVGDNYELVTSASSLVAGSQVVFAYRGWDDDYDAYYPVAMSETQQTDYRDVYDWQDSKVSLNAAGTIISWIEATPDVAEFTVEAGSSNGTYAFKDESGYIYCASTNSTGYLRTQATKDANASWTISISSGEAEMVSGSSQTRKYLWYNPTNDRFSCYASNYNNNGGKKTSIFQRSVSSYTTSPACTTYSVSTCSPGPSNGTISVSAASVSPGGNVTVTFTPSANYMLSAVTVTSGTASVGDPSYSSGPTSGGTVSITNIQSDITVCATFVAIPLYTVTFVDVDNSNATQTRTQASYGANVTAPSTSSSSAHDPCDNTWTFVGWAPSNTLTGETTEPTGFIAAGGTINGASITGATTYYSVYTNSSDGTTAFTPGKSGTYYFKAITTAATPVTLYATGSMSSNKYPSNQLTKIPFDIQYNSSTTKYTIKNTLTDKYLAPENDNGNNLVERNTSFEWSLEVPDIRGALGNAASGEWFFSYLNASSNKRFIYCDGAYFKSLSNGNYSYYALYLEPASSIYYYNASSCTELVTMTFHPIAGGDPTWADGHPKAEYTDVAKGTISTFPTDSYEGWTFLGWTASMSYNDNREGAGETLNEENASATAPSQTIYSTGGNSYNLNADIDMYPVFTKFADNEPFDDINGGDYYIYYIADADIASSTDVYGATNRMYASSYSSYRYSATTSCANATLFTFTKLPNGKWTIYDNNNNGGTAVNPKQYLCGTENSNNLSLQATATAANYGEWNITMHNGNQFEAVSVDGQTFSASTTNALTGDFKNYDSDNLEGGDKAQYHRIYLGSCTERVYSSDPSNQPRVEIHGTAKVTSTAGKNIKAASVLTVSATNIATANLTVTSDNSAFKFSLTSDGTYTANVTIPVVSNKVGVTPIYVEYNPTITTDGIEGATITVSDGASPTPTTATTNTGDVQGRHLPAQFVIAAKWGDKWYALPANCTESTSSTTGVLIEVDNASDPTTATYAPSYTKWGLQTVRPSRKGEYGTRMVFTEQLTTATAEDQKALFNGSTTNIQVNAMYKNYMGDATEKYEWIPTTTDLKDYMLTSATTLGGDASARTVSLSNKGVFGTLLNNKAYDGKVRLLPATFVEPAEIQVVEWKASSVVVMYSGSGTKATTQLGDDAPSSAQSLSSAKVDHGVFELTTGTLTSAKNEPLNITIQNGSDAIVGRKSLVVPAIVSDNQDAPLGLETDETKLTDVVILDGATLSAVATKYTFKNITVYPGGKLVIGSGKQLGMASLTLRGGSSWGAATYEHKYPQFVVNNTASDAYSNSAAVINYDYVTTKDQYYSFVLPYNGSTSAIKYPVDIYGSAVSASNTGSFEFQYYDGAARATGATGWKVLAEPATLVAGTGYTFFGMPKKVDAYDGSDSEHANTRQRYGIHRIPMSVAAATVQAGETGGGEPANKPISINVILASKNNDSGWNLVGNPYMANVSGLSNTDIQVGQLVHTSTVPWDGKWQWDNPTSGVRYIVTTDDGQTFESQQASTATLKAFKNFFVQIQNAEANTLVIPATTRTDKSLAPARYMDEVEQDIQLAVDLISEARKDKVDLLINDIYTAEFDQDGDFTKMMNSTKLNIYGVYPGDNLSFIAVDKATAANSIAVGYQVPAGGDYSLQLSDREYVMVDAIEALYVTDHEVSPEVTTNLLDGPYNFHVNNAETNDTRFTISIRLAPKTPTDIDIVPSEGQEEMQPVKFIYHDKMYILRGGVIYDATGKRVKEVRQ